jgi:hypothetical protein
MAHEPVAVLIELQATAAGAPPTAAELARSIDVPGLVVDPDYEPVPMAGEHGQATLVYRARVPADRIAAVERGAGVVRVWSDAPVAPFSAGFG